MGQHRKQVYFPLEIKPREFQSRILLGGVMAQHGYRAHIGAKVPLNAAILAKPDKGGVYFYKSTRAKDSTEAILKKVDAFCAIDEEMGLAVENLELHFATRLKGLERVDRFFAISEHVAQAARNVRPELSDRIRVTGWPKVDSWRQEFAPVHQKKAQEYRARFGDFILFSSDFGVMTQERLEVEDARAKASGKNEQIRAALKDVWGRAISEFERFCEALRQYDALDDVPLLIVRPHPAEDHHIWTDRFANARNIRIVYEDDVSGWVHACRLMVHRGCTTAVEARIGNVPTFFWDAPGTHPRTSTLPYLLSAKITHLPQLLDVWPNPQAAMRDLDIPRHLLEFGKELASERILQEIEALDVHPSPALHVNAGLRGKLALRAVRKQFQALSRNALKAFGIQSWDHLKQNKRQAGVTSDEVDQLLSLFFPEQKFHVVTLTDGLVAFEAA